MTPDGHVEILVPREELWSHQGVNRSCTCPLYYSQLSFVGTQGEKPPRLLEGLEAEVLCDHSLGSGTVFSAQWPGLSCPPLTP